MLIESALVKFAPVLHQKLPTAHAPREALREKGQFWTPPWIAQAMVAYVLRDGNRRVFDPAVGAGAFLSAAKALSAEFDMDIEASGTELYANALNEARANGLNTRDLAAIQIRDFVLSPPPGIRGGIVANPPYIRHHRLGARAKARLREFCVEFMGAPIDGRAGLHVYFLLRALQLLERGQRLAFIVPADICEGVFARQLWDWVTLRFCLEAVVTFSPEAPAFPRVDTNALVLMIRNAPPEANFIWARCAAAHSDALKNWVLAEFEKQAVGVESTRRLLSEALETGFSRPPQSRPKNQLRLSDFARVQRGIATGANEFFFLTAAQAKALKIPSSLLVRAIGRTRDISGDEIRREHLNELERRGRPTWLFAPDGKPPQEYPRAVREYLKKGEGQGLPRKALISSRRPWYKMEQREVPPFLFAYLGRRSTRFIRNSAGVVPLTGFLCVYPHDDSPEAIEKLWRMLSHPQTIAGLHLVGKSYGDGAIKVEPRALEQLVMAHDA